MTPTPPSSPPAPRPSLISIRPKICTCGRTWTAFITGLTRPPRGPIAVWGIHPRRIMSPHFHQSQSHRYVPIPDLAPQRSHKPEQPDYCGYRLADLEQPSQPAVAQDNSYIFHLAQQFRNGSARPQVQDHRSSIARASDNFLAQASSIFSDGHSSLRRGSPLDYRPSVPQQTTSQRDSRPPSRKRSREPLDEASYHVKVSSPAPISDYKLMISRVSILG